MWDEMAGLLATFESGVLTGLDPEGYPYSVRCRPEVDRTARVLRIKLPGYAPVQAGPASLLCHEHDEELWNLRSFLVRGTLAREDGGWAFRPQRFVPGAGVEGARGMARLVTGSRRNARRYLEKRGLSRPRIPWDRINEIKAQANRSRDSPAATSDPRFDGLALVSALYLLTATVAIRAGMPGELAGRASGRAARGDFALSPGLAMLAAQAIFTVLSTRGGKAGTAGAAGLTALGTGATVGMLGEPVTYRVLSPRTFDPAGAALVSALIALPSLTAVLGARRLQSMRSTR